MIPDPPEFHAVSKVFAKIGAAPVPLAVYEAAVRESIATDDGLSPILTPVRVS